MGKKKANGNIKNNLGATSKPLAVGQYNRTAALAHARKYWNKVPTDNYIASSTLIPSYREVPADSFFEHHLPEDGHAAGHHDFAMSGNNVVMTCKDADDCTHFLSCCIGTPSPKDLTHH